MKHWIEVLEISCHYTPSRTLLAIAHAHEEARRHAQRSDMDGWRSP
jgi:hypothetical protein